MKKSPILVVTPDKTFRSVILQTFTAAEGFETAIASDPIAGLEIIRPDHRMALVEFDMAEMNGLEFLQQVRTGRTAARRNMAVGVLAAVTNDAMLAAAIALDLNAMLLKPISVKDILRRVTRTMTEFTLPKPVAEYERVGIPAGEMQRARAEGDGRSLPSVRLASQPLFKSEGGASRRSDAGFGPLVRRSVLEIGVGWLIGQDVDGPNGARLVGAGTIVNQRLLTRLQDMAQEGLLPAIWSRAPLPPSK